MPVKRKRTSLSWFRWTTAWVWILCKDNLCVDNIITGCDTDENALGYYEQSRSIIVNAAFNLRSWASNSQPLQNQTTVDRVLDTEPCYTNVLGLWWDTTSDTLTLASKDVSPSTADTIITRCEILRDPRFMTHLIWSHPSPLMPRSLCKILGS